jgi:hypothetical protein
LTNAAELQPHDFAYGMPLETPTPGTAYHFTLPLEVYSKVTHEDLRDLRVFNARGEVVPYELQEPPLQPATRPKGPSLPLFPLRADARATLNGVRVTVHAEGAAVDLQTGATSPDSHVIASYVLDGRDFPQSLSGLQLQWPPGAPEYSGNIRVEASDDLGSWRLVKSDVPVVNLRTGGLELVQNLLEFPSTKAKFWRLTWLGKTAPFELTGVIACATLDRPIAPRSTLTVSGSHINKQDSELTFDLGAKLPVTQVNMALPESNSVLKIELLSRARASDAWHSITQGEFYRVSAGPSDHRNEPIRVPTNFDRFWLARQLQPGGPIGSVKLEATWDAVDLVFLAQGPGPFLLAYGNASASQSAVALDPLLKGVGVIPARAGAPHELGGTDRLRPPPKTVPWKMAALWTALGLGVLLLAWMAYRLSRELGTPTTGQQ